MTGSGITISTSPISQMIDEPAREAVDLYRKTYLDTLSIGTMTGAESLRERWHYSIANDPWHLSIDQRVHTRTFGVDSQRCDHAMHATGTVQSFFSGMAYDAQLRCDVAFTSPSW